MKVILYILIGLVVLVLALFAVLGKKSRSGHAPGLIEGRLAPCSGKPNCVSSEEGTDAWHKVGAYRGVSLTDLKSAIKRSGGKITKQDDVYLAAEFTSKMFKFVDDFEARQEGDTIQIRSASRVGHSDAGVNRKRVEAIRNMLKQEKE